LYLLPERSPTGSIRAARKWNPRHRLGFVMWNFGDTVEDFMRTSWKVAAVAAVICVLFGAAAPGLAQNSAAPATAPTAPQTSAPQATPETPQTAPQITVLNKGDVEGVLGREVLSATNENMGRIVDVLVDRTGQVRAAIIDFGGFLGVGSRKIAVDWNALDFPSPGKPDARITLELTRDQVKAAPEYQEGKPVVVLGALGKLEPLPSN
jgi:PRC-barrel domain